jgi:hypothetical protein
MIDSHVSASPAIVRFVETKLEEVKSAMRVPGFLPVISVVPAGIEILAGTISTIYSLALAFFFTIAPYLHIISADRKALWDQSKGKEHCWKLLRASFALVGIGALHTVPIAGNISTFCIYTFEKGEKKFNLLSQRIQTLEDALTNHPQPSNIQTRVEKLEKASNRFPQRIGALRSHLSAIEERLEALGDIDGADIQRKLSKRRSQISHLKSKVKTLRIEVRSLHRLRSAVAAQS